MLTAERKRSENKPSIEFSTEEIQILFRDKLSTYALVPVKAVAILPQTRLDFKEIESLSDGIADIGLIQHLSGVFLTEDQALTYVKMNNERWVTDFEVKNLPYVISGGKKHYLILIAGERRLRALTRLLTEGCTKCQTQYGQGSCYFRHVDYEGDLTLMRLYNITDYDDAVKIQEQENTHIQISPPRKAFAIKSSWMSSKARNPDLRFDDFCRNLGISPEAGRNAIKFCEMHPVIQRMVDNKEISYGVAIEIHRLQKQIGMSDTEAILEAVVARDSQMTVSGFRKRADGYISNQQGQQTEMFFFDPVEVANQRKSLVLRRRAKRTEAAIMQAAIDLRQLTDLAQSGVVDEHNSPLGNRRVVDSLLKLVRQESALAPHVKSVTVQHESDTLLPPVTKRLKRLSSVLPEDNETSSAV